MGRIRKPTRKGDGVIYEKPGSNGHTYVKISTGDPQNTQPGQRYNNVRWQKDGRSLNVDGKVVNKQSQESHIPVEDFRFKLEIFK